MKGPPMKLGLPVLALVLLSALTALAPLAYATLPDPTWIAGLWDDNDYDDVIVRITSDVGAIDLHLVRSGSPVRTVVTTVLHTDEGPACSRSGSSPPTRAPPVRRCSV